MFEELIAYHCAPALAGIKTANIVACQKKKIKNVFEEIDRLNREMNARGIYFHILNENEKRALIIVYRYNILEQYLKSDAISSFLKELGYPDKFSVKSYLNHLKKRLEYDSFPHEIGAFLGYPIHDIYGFINQEQCLMVGDWKVYRDVERAKELFNRYSICKCTVLKRVSEGRTLSQLFAAN